MKEIEIGRESNILDQLSEHWNVLLVLVIVQHHYKTVVLRQGLLGTNQLHVDVLFEKVWLFVGDLEKALER